MPADLKFIIIQRMHHISSTLKNTGDRTHTQPCKRETMLGFCIFLKVLLCSLAPYSCDGNEMEHIRGMLALVTGFFSKRLCFFLNWEFYHPSVAVASKASMLLSTCWSSCFCDSVGRIPEAVQLSTKSMAYSLTESAKLSCSACKSTGFLTSRLLGLVLLSVWYPED